MQYADMAKLLRRNPALLETWVMENVARETLEQVRGSKV